MRCDQYRYADFKTFESDFPWFRYPDDETLFIQFFVSESVSLLERVGRRLATAFARAVVTGVTAEASIVDGRTVTDAIVVVVLQLSHSRVEARLLSDQTRRLPSDLRAVVILSDVRVDNLEHVLSGLSLQAPVEYL